MQGVGVLRHYYRERANSGLNERSFRCFNSVVLKWRRQLLTVGKCQLIQTVVAFSSLVLAVLEFYVQHEFARKWAGRARGVCTWDVHGLLEPDVGRENVFFVFSL